MVEAGLVMDAPPAGHSGSTEMEVDFVVLVALVFVPVPVAVPVLVPVLVPVAVIVAPVPVPVPVPVAVSEAVFEAVSVPLAVCVFEAVVAVSVMVDESAILLALASSEISI